MQVVSIEDTSSRPLVVVSPFIDVVGATLVNKAERSSAAVCAWLIDAHSAIAPDTWGVAIEVPLYEP